MTEITIPKGWSQIRLGDHGIIKTSSVDKVIEDGEDTVSLINYMDVYKNHFIDSNTKLSITSASHREKLSFNIIKGDILFTPSSETPEDIGHSAAVLEDLPDTLYSYHLVRYRLFDQSLIDHKFRGYVFNSPDVLRRLTKLATGSTRYTISKNSIENVVALLPPLREQKEISEVLIKWHQALQLNLKLLESLSEHRKHTGQIFIYHLGSSSCVKYFPINSLVNKIKRGFTPENEAFYQEIGIRSHAKGIFHKEPVTGKSLGNKSVFWIEPDCFVVNIVFAWEQAVAKTTEAEVGMIASHRFPMYKPKEGVLDLDYLLYFFKSAKGKNLLELASPGGAGRNKTLGQSEFLKLKIPVPPIEEQKKIVRLLNAADKEIELQKQKIEAIKLQKKGLMQQLLTGKKRIKL
ncbi:restriction endonuclease subunit S [Niabella beijingensis]|uniref:restriction endonuclease subunit S n=1 Tax=Niabella beijingensis TaxID=2872700 RepID=UPI001CC1777D|nr:restriction endonuclease subunit S [Niabella beijingensis]MBZ4187688.1 restriction endonuclease subunit S [Niabella beijingensis]